MLATLVLGLLLPQVEPALRVVGPAPALVRLGDASHLRLIVQQPDGDVRVEPPRVEGLAIQLDPPQSQQMTQIVNGRIHETSSVTFDCRLRPEREGRFTLPPFVVRVGARQLHSEPFALECVKDVRGQDRGYLRITPSAERVYVHEPIRFMVEFGVDAAVNLVQGQLQGHPASDVDLQAPWLDELPGAVTIEGEQQSIEHVAKVNSRFTSVRYQADARQGSRALHIYRLQRSFLPTTPGERSLSPPLLAFQVEVGRPRIGLFGERVRGETETLYVYGEPLRIEVLPLPATGQPAGFSGAVGRFAIAATVDRRQVKVGNSIRLTLLLTGSGNFEFLRVPELDRLEGFHLRGKTEKRNGQRVEAVYDLTPLHARVTEVPAVTWSYFDTRPDQQRYAELRTAPIPIEVLPLAAGETLAPLPGTETRSVTPGVDDIYDIRMLVGEPARLEPALPPALAALLLALPWLCCGLALVGRRRLRARRADRAGRRARRARGNCEAELRAGDPAAALVGYLADRLDREPAAIIAPDLADRLRAAGLEPDLTRDVQSAVDEGVAQRYGGKGALTAERVRGLVARLERVAFGLLLGVLVTAGRAQDSAATAIAAYRSGDYAAAERAFASLCAVPDPDRRLLCNLGNAQYRQGRYAQALWSWERARLALPRDPELQQNLALARRKLEVDGSGGEPFLATIANLLRSLTAAELLGAALALHLLAAFGLVIKRWRGLLGACGVAALVPALLLTAELLWWRPSRLPSGIVLAPQAALLSEPRAGMEPVLKLRAGVTVTVLGGSDGWLLAEVQGRRGYLEAGAVGVVR
jgi:hypothetical protein